MSSSSLLRKSHIAKDLGNHSFKDGASKVQPFPDSRRGNLDYNVLLQMGFTSQRMESGNALFFYQLLLPMRDPTKSGINADPRKTYASKVKGFTNSYAYPKGIGGSYYGHKVKPVDFDELVVHFDTVVH
jgi:hypothetical protein